MFLPPTEHLHMCTLCSAHEAGVCTLQGGLCQDLEGAQAGGELCRGYRLLILQILLRQHFKVVCIGVARILVELHIPHK